MKDDGDYDDARQTEADDNVFDNGDYNADEERNRHENTITER